MVASFAAAAARRDQAWAKLIRIEAFGTFAGSTTWCSAVPAYASGNPLYVATLRRWPDPLSERSPQLGGLPEAGGLNVELVDYLEQISLAMRPDRTPRTLLAANLSRTATSLTVTGAALSGAELPTADDVVWVGNEAITYTSRSGGTLSGLTRGALGTEAQSHQARDPVYTRAAPYIGTRRLSMYLAPIDGDSAATEVLVGQYRVDTCDVGRELSSWIIGGTTQLKYLGRQLGGRLPRTMRLADLAANGVTLPFALMDTPGLGAADPMHMLWPDFTAYVEIDEREIIRATAFPWNQGRGDGAIEVVGRGEAGTERADIRAGQIARRVLVANTTFGDFRVSPGPSPSMDRADGDAAWERRAHAVDLGLCALTSSAHPDDGLELVNHAGVGGLYADASLPVEARANWSSLPVGFGAGIPSSLFDKVSWVRVKQRSPGFEFPNTVLGRGPVAVARWLTDTFLAPIGAFVSTVRGQIALILPRLPIVGETPTATWGLDSILEVRSLGLALNGLASSVTYLARGPRGQSTPITFRASDLGIYTQRGLYSVDDKPIEIPVPNATTDDRGLRAFLLRLAMRRLLRFARPHWRLSLRVSAAEHVVGVGDLVAVSHPDLPDLDTGRRGWTSVICQVTEITPPFIDPKQGAVIDVELIAYAPNQRGGRIGPSAEVLSSTTSGGNRVCAIAESRYSRPDGGLLGLPDSDAAGFSVGDVVQEVAPDGVLVGATRTVVDVSPPDEITVSGTTAPTAGNVFEHAAYGAQTTTQRARFVSLASEATIEVATGVPAWRYAED